jgi:hypothetical protein
VLLLQSCVRIVWCAGGNGLPVGSPASCLIICLLLPPFNGTRASDFGPLAATLRVRSAVAGFKLRPP